MSCGVVVSITGEAVQGHSHHMVCLLEPYPTLAPSSRQCSLCLRARAAASPWPAASSRGLLASAGPPGSSSASARRLLGSLPSVAVAPVLAPPARAAVTGASYRSTQGLPSPWEHQTGKPTDPYPARGCSLPVRSLVIAVPPDLLLSWGPKHTEELKGKCR